MWAWSSTNTHLLQRKSNLACSQAAAKRCLRQMVRLASHGGRRNASKQQEQTRTETSKSKSKVYTQTHGMQRCDSCTWMFTVGDKQKSVTNMWAHNLITSTIRVLRLGRKTLVNLFQDVKPSSLSVPLGDMTGSPGSSDTAENNQ